MEMLPHGFCMPNQRFDRSWGGWPVGTTRTGSSTMSSSSTDTPEIGLTPTVGVGAGLSVVAWVALLTEDVGLT